MKVIGQANKSITIESQNNKFCVARVIASHAETNAFAVKNHEYHHAITLFSLFQGCFHETKHPLSQTPNPILPVFSSEAK